MCLPSEIRFASKIQMWSFAFRPVGRVGGSFVDGVFAPQARIECAYLRLLHQHLCG